MSEGGFEQNIPFGERKKHEMQEVSHEEFEYRDKDGKLVCTVILETMPSTDEYNGLIKIIQALYLRSNGGKEPIEVFRSTDSDFQAVLIPNMKVTENESFSRFLNRIEMKTLDHPLDLFVFFHELGHAEQNQDPRYKTLSDVYEGGWALSIVEVTNQLRALKELMPDVISTESWDEIQLLIDIGDEYAALFEKKEYGLTAALESRFCDMREHLPLEEIRRATTQVLELDANIRALIRIRDLRKNHGINLLKNISVPKEKTIKWRIAQAVKANQKSCRDSMEDSIDEIQADDDVVDVDESILKQMQDALANYGTSMSQMRRIFHGSTPLLEEIKK